MKDKSVKFRRSNLLFLVLSILALTLLSSYSRLRPSSADKNIRLMFYNVENLFDTLDSSLDDDEFLPEGLRRWNKYKYSRKINNLSRVIIAAGGWTPPSLIGLCEVENKNVLSDLLSTTVLKSLDYNSIYSEGTDKRGIGVALLYSKEFSLLATKNYCPTDINGDTLATRSILFVKLACREDTVGIVVTHWPSRRGGVSATDRYREIVAETIKDKILSAEKDTKIIIMGDFNCEPGSYAVENMISSIPGTTTSGNFYNPSISISQGSIGSYKFQGRWLNYDQIIIDRRFLVAGEGLQYIENSFAIVQEEFLLNDDKTYRGMKPFSTWAGPRYIGGYSDHLPLIADLVYIN